MRVVLALMWLLHWLPLPILGLLGDMIGALLFLLLRSRRRITLTTLRLCLPQLSEAQRHTLGRRHLQTKAHNKQKRNNQKRNTTTHQKRQNVFEPEVPLEAFLASPT